MYRFTGDLQELGFLKFDVTNLAYFLPGRQRSAVIGVGGGRDMLSAALFGLQDITGVEINPIFIKLHTGRAEFSDLLIKRETDFSGFNKLRELPGTKFVVDEGRSWFARSKDTFDIIQMSLIDTWAATGAGAFTLSENGLYTVEAMKIFLNRLSPKGVFTVSRWYNPARPKETGRMLSLAVAALLEMGVQEPGRHIFVAASDRIANLLISREPFSASDLMVLDETVKEYEYEVLIGPGRLPASEVLRNIVTADSRQDLDRYTSTLELDLTPPTDDRPFFFNQFPFYKPVQAVKFFYEMYGTGGYGGIYEGNLAATGTIVILFFVSLALVLATIIIPLRPAVKDVGGKLVIGGTIYFVLIGIGFMMTEIGLLQRTSVFLGHPMYSLSVLLFTLILTTGLGSLLSERILLGTQARFASWAFLTAVYILLLPVWIPDVFLAFDGADLFIRAVVCVVCFAPAGLLMGFGFPTGMRLISSIDRKPTPWFWGINGAAGVLASIVAVATSIGFGISTTLSIGGGCYLLLIPITLIFMSSAFRSRPMLSEAAVA
jgi:SAM-dependent methyltransferase